MFSYSQIHLFRKILNALHIRPEMQQYLNLSPTLPLPLFPSFSFSSPFLFTLVSKFMGGMVSGGVGAVVTQTTIVWKSWGIVWKWNNSVIHSTLFITATVMRFEYIFYPIKCSFCKMYFHVHCALCITLCVCVPFATKLSHCYIYLYLFHSHFLAFLSVQLLSSFHFLSDADDPNINNCETVDELMQPNFKYRQLQLNSKNEKKKN